MSNDGNSSTNLKGKRKKKLPTNANPLFTQWLTEWKEEAAEKGWKSAHTYAKALKTLKLFPLPLETGKDCRLLQNFGDKICKMLDEKLAEYRQNQDTTPVDLNSPIGCNKQPKRSKKPNQILPHQPENHAQVTRNTSTFTSSMGGLHPAVPSTSSSGSFGESSELDTNSAPSRLHGSSKNGPSKTHAISDNSDSDTETSTTSQKRKRNSQGTRCREYVPSYRSGPYALILTLYRYMQDPSFKGYMMKTELCHAAQPLSDKSFTRPDPGSHYTAWSSMGTLVRKGLVIKSSSPARYSLTDSGYELGERLDRAENEGGGIVDEEVNELDGNQHTRIPKPVQQNIEQPVRTRQENHRDDQFDECVIPADRDRGYSDLEERNSAEDDDLERAIAESLLSYSHELSMRSSFSTQSDVSLSSHTDIHKSLSPHVDLTTGESNRDYHSDKSPLKQKSGLSKPAKDISNRCDEEDLIVIDGEDEDSGGGDASVVSPLRFGGRLHSLSPSPTPGNDSIRSSLSRQQTFSSLSAAVATTSSTSPSCVIPPLRIPERLHSLHSLSPSPPTVIGDTCSTLSQQSTSSTALTAASLTSYTSPLPQNNDISQSSQNVETATTKSQLSSLHLIKVCDHDVMEISDDSDLESHGNKKKIATDEPKLTYLQTFDSDDDDLPDLDIPLSKRLLQKGHIESDLLKTSVPLSTAATMLSLSSAATTSGPLNCGENVQLKPKNISQPVLQTDGAIYELDKNNTHTHPKLKSSISNASVASNQKASCPGPRVVGTINQSCDPYELCIVGDSTEVDVVCTSRKTGFVSTGETTDSLLSQASSTSSYSTTTSSSTSSSTAQTLPSQCNPDFTFQPGTFDIILCLDNREFYGSKSSSKTLLPDLMKSGVQCDLRLLHVGDLLWIARERVEHQIDRVKGRELVLDYIIERKRMDDLVSSMTDGRLKEQKFRLKHCGLSEPIILIEEYGSIQNFSLSEDRIKQSIVNSQIIDGFKVKRCGGTRDAVSYLSIMTRFLQQHFSSKTLHAVSLDHVKAIKGQQHLYNSELYLIPFEIFNEASIKHKDLRVRELFAKQLIQVPGLSADRARAITTLYPTVSRLLEAYKSCNSEADKEKLLSKIKCGKKERNLGVALSRVLYMLYTEKGSLS